MDLKVCLLNDSFPPLIDGVANTVINYANVIHNDLGSCSVVCPRYPKTIDDENFPVIRYPSLNTTKTMSGYRTGNPFGPKILHKLEKEKFDIIHSHCPFSSSVLARILRERVEVPYVFTYHTKFDMEIAKVFSSESARKIATKLTINNISAADEIWVVSNGAADNLRSMGFQGDTVVMENGVDMPPERVAPEHITALRQKLAIPDGVPVFMFVGRCLWYKGIRISLDALCQLQKAGYDFRFVVVGHGLEREEIEAYAKEIGIGERCIFTGNIHDRFELRTYFGLGDLFLFPSTFDTNGLVVREAAANQLASVMIKDSCASEGIVDGQNGLLVEENADSMAKKLVWACNHMDVVRAIGITAQKEIYVSWADAITKAYHRYEYLHEQMLAGKMPHKDVRGQGLVGLLADWNAFVGKVQALPRAAFQKIRNK